MAITSSAKKANRVAARKHVFNLRRKDAMRDSSKELLKTLTAKDISGAEKMLAGAYKAIDKAKKRGVIKANTAARKKSRLAEAIAKAKA